jgi:hypothetical protein
MIKVRHAAERGKTKTNWLDSSHTFSFDRYYDLHYSGFRALLVINEDFVAPAQGFGTHFHDNMEGSIGVNGAELQAGDGAALSEELSIEISARADSLFFCCLTSNRSDR